MANIFKNPAKVFRKAEKKINEGYKKVENVANKVIDERTGAKEKTAAKQAQAAAEARAEAAEQANNKLEDQGVLWEKALLDATIATEKTKALLEICDDARQFGG